MRFIRTAASVLLLIAGASSVDAAPFTWTGSFVFKNESKRQATDFHLESNDNDPISDGALSSKVTESSPFDVLRADGKQIDLLISPLAQDPRGLAIGSSFTVKMSIVTARDFKPTIRTAYFTFTAPTDIDEMLKDPSKSKAPGDQPDIKDIVFNAAVFGPGGEVLFGDPVVVGNAPAPVPVPAAAALLPAGLALLGALRRRRRAG